MSKVAVKGLAAVCSVLLVVLALSIVAAQTVIQPTSSPVASSVQPASAVSPANWFYEGTNQSTPEVGVSYSQSTSVSGQPNGTQDTLSGSLGLAYNDGTGEGVALGIQYGFNPGV